MGLLTQKDVTVWRKWFKEMAKLRGFSVKYSYVTNRDSNMDMTIYSEFNPEYSTPIDMDVIFDENPSVNTLALFGWVSENPEDKPYIVRLPFDAPNLSVKAKLSIPSLPEFSTSTDEDGNAILNYRDFEIVDIKSNLEYPDCWICRLVPIFNTTDVSKDYNESNYNYLYNNDTPSNRDSGDKDEDSNYQFLNLGGK